MNTPRLIHALLLGTLSLSFAAPAAEAATRPGDADHPTLLENPRHRQKVAAIKSGEYDLALIGDSIAHTLGDVEVGKYAPLKAVWDRHFAPRRAINLGYSGYRTEHILGNLHDGELDFKRSPKAAILLIGTNNTDDWNYPKAHSPEQVLAGTRAIVELIRRRHPETKILILRIFPRGGDAETGVGPGVFHSSVATIERVRRAGEMTARLADGHSVFWLDVNHVFLRPDGSINPDLMPDLLHPNAAGAEAWVQAVEPLLSTLMGDDPIVDAPANRAVVPVPGVESDSNGWMARHEAVMKVKDAVNPRMVLLGDDDLQRWGGEPLPDRTIDGPGSLENIFPGKNILNLGMVADRTENVLWRIEQGELDGLRPRHIVLHIGAHNFAATDKAPANTPEDIAQGVREILVRVRAKCPDARVTVLGLLPRGEAGGPPWGGITRINTLLAELAKEARTTFIDPTAAFTRPDGTVPRTLLDESERLTDAGYALWAQLLAQALR